MLSTTPNRQNENFQRNGNCIPWSQPRHCSWVSASEAQMKKKRIKQVGLLLPPSPRFAALWERQGLSKQKACSGSVAPWTELWGGIQGNQALFPALPPVYWKNWTLSSRHVQQREFPVQGKFLISKIFLWIGKNKIKSEMWNFPQMENFIFGEHREHSSSPMFSCQCSIPVFCPVSCPAPRSSAGPARSGGTCSEATGETLNKNLM